MKDFRLLAASLMVVFSMEGSSCDNGSQKNAPVVGTWKECRTETQDGYGMSTWKFCSGGKGIFGVDGMIDKVEVGFTWKSINDSVVVVTLNGEKRKLKLSGGFLIENTQLERILFKKV